MCIRLGIIIGLAVTTFGFSYARETQANEVELPSNLSEVSLLKITERIYVLHGIQAMPDGKNEGMISNVIAGVIARINAARCMRARIGMVHSVLRGKHTLVPCGV